MDFNHKIKKIDNVTTGIEIVITNENFAKKYEDTLKQAISKVKINGFRPGKAPRNIIESMYKDSIIADTRERLVRESIEDGIKKNNLKVYNISKIDFKKDENKKNDTDNGFSFSATLELIPTFPEIPNYDGISVEAQQDKYSEKKLKDAINDFLARFKEPKEIKEDRKAKEDDEKKVSVKVTYKNNEGTWSHEYNDIFLISNTIDSALKEAVVGMKKGETKEVKSKDEVTKENIKYKEGEGNLSLTLNGIYEMVLPELTDDFVKNLPNFGLNSVSELEARMKEVLENEITYANDQRVKVAVMDKLLESFDFDIPQSMIDREIENMLSYNQNGHMFSMKNIQQDMIDKLREIYSPKAKERIKTASLIDLISEKEKISPTPGEVEEYIVSMAFRSNTPVDIIKKDIKKNNLENAIKIEITRSKTWDHICKKANVSFIPLKEGDDTQKASSKKSSKKDESKTTEKKAKAKEEKSTKAENTEAPKRGRKKKEETK